MQHELATVICWNKMRVNLDFLNKEKRNYSISFSDVKNEYFKKFQLFQMNADFLHEYR